MKTPAGLYVQLNPQNIANGEMLQELTQALNAGVRKLLDSWISQGARKGELKLQLTIMIAAAKDSDDHVRIRHGITMKLPIIQTRTLAKAAGGKLIVQPSGSNGGAPEQQVMAFDGQGTLQGAIDPVTGEIHEVDAVAGKVGASA